MTSILALNEMALTISTICCCAIVNSSTLRVTSRSTPREFNLSFASRIIAFSSRIPVFFVISRPRKIFL